MNILKSVVLFLILLLAGSSMVLSAQNRSISGKVFDTNEEPLIGVTVTIENTTIGAITDIDGAFTLQVPEGKVVLNVSYVGFVPQKVTVASGQSNVTVRLSEDAVLLNEVVVVGYGKQKKVNLTGAVASVGGEELENRVAGPFHPAFMELCRSAIFRENVLKALQARNDSEVTIDVDPRMLSVALGQKKENLQHFSKHGYTVHIRPDASLSGGTYRLR